MVLFDYIERGGETTVETVGVHNPLVSVVIPVYNAEKYLKNAYTYLAEQQLQNFEVIFVDDCSSDATEEMLKRFADRDARFRWIRHARNQGCGMARNTGIRDAAGTYILCLDVDDKYHPALLQKMVWALESTNADVAVCNSMVTNMQTGERRHFGQWRRLQERMNGEILIVDEPCKFHDIVNLIDYVAWSKMIRRSFFLEKELWFPNLKYYEDIPFSFLTCLQAGRIAFVNETLIEYHIMNQDSMTAWKIPKEFYLVDAFHCVFRKKDRLDWDSVGSELMGRMLENIGAVYYSDRTTEKEKRAIRLRMGGPIRRLWQWDSLLERGLFGANGTRLCEEIRNAPVYQAPVLLHGDTIGICGMSDPLPEKAAGEVESLRARCAALGLQACFTPDLQPWSASYRMTDSQEKAFRLMELYARKDISYIFDMSGGNLANEVLPYLPFPLIAKSGKIFAGYSDLTCILNAIYVKTGLPSILYRINNLYKDCSAEQMRRFCRSMMQGEPDLFEFQYVFLNGNSMQGVVVGGNLRCLLKLAGTEYWPDMRGKILFLESLDTDMPAIRAGVAQLKQMNVFESISGILIGTFGMCEGSDLSPIDPWILSQLPLSLPAAKTKELGHGYLSKAIWIGKEVALQL